MNPRLTDAQRQVRTATLTGLAPRVAVLVLGLAAVVLSDPPRVVLVFTLLGLLVSMAVPERAGAVIPAAGLVLSWMIEQGSSGATPGVRVVVFALAMYLMVSAGALAAGVPLNAQVEPAVFTRWTRQLVVPCAAAVVVGAALSVTARPAGSGLIDVLGLVGGIGVLIVIVRAFLRR